MDAQQGNPVEENQQATLSRKDEPASEEAKPQVTLQEVLEQFNQRIGVCENLLSEIMKGFQMSGQAINRLESFTFAQMKVLLEKEITEYKEFYALQQELQGFDNLHEYWGVEPIEEEQTSSEEAASSEE